MCYVVGSVSVLCGWVLCLSSVIGLGVSMCVPGVCLARAARVWCVRYVCVLCVLCVRYVGVLWVSCGCYVCVLCVCVRVLCVMCALCVVSVCV